MRRPPGIRNKHQLGKKASIKSLKRYCSEIWSELVRTRDNHKCIICGETKYIQAHHIITRKYIPTMFDINCGISLCSGCHTFRMLSAHVSPWFIYEWLKENRPEQYKWFISKKDLLKTHKKSNTNINYYRNELKKLLNEFERISPQTIKKCKYSPFTTKEEKNICEDYIKKLLSRRDLSMKYGTNDQVIITILKRNNIEMRKPGTRNKQFLELKKELN